MNVVGVVLFVSSILVTEALKSDVVSLDIVNLSISTEHCNYFLHIRESEKMSATPFMINANFFLFQRKRKCYINAQ